MNPIYRLRLFHLLFVLAFLIAYFTGDEGELLHVWIGYGLVVLLVSRSIMALTRVKGFPALRPSFRPGMAVAAASRALVVALLLSIGVTVATGLTMVDNARVLGITAAPAIAPAYADGAGKESDRASSEFLEDIEDIHEVAANATLGLAGLHVLFLLMFRRRFALNMIPGFDALAGYCRGLMLKAGEIYGGFRRAREMG